MVDELLDYAFLVLYYFCPDAITSTILNNWCMHSTSTKFNISCLLRHTFLSSLSVAAYSLMCVSVSMYMFLMPLKSSKELIVL